MNFTLNSKSDDKSGDNFSYHHSYHPKLRFLSRYQLPPQNRLHSASPDHPLST